MMNPRNAENTYRHLLAGLLQRENFPDAALYDLDDAIADFYDNLDVTAKDPADPTADDLIIFIGEWSRDREDDFILKPIEECQSGDRLDMGIFDGIDPRGPGQGPNTVNVRLASGLHYTETANAKVRVWGAR